MRENLAMSRVVTTGLLTIAGVVLLSASYQESADDGRRRATTACRAEGEQRLREERSFAAIRTIVRATAQSPSRYEVEMSFATDPSDHGPRTRVTCHLERYDFAIWRAVSLDIH